LQNAWKSFTDPGSVATMRSTWPLDISFSALRARRIGSGQLRPRASSSLSWIIVWAIEASAPRVGNIRNV
jgi:hypothetical protein